MMLYFCPRNRDTMRPNRHITPLFRLFGQWLKTGFRSLAEMLSSYLLVPSIAWFHPQLWSCLRCNASGPSPFYGIWHLGKNKFIKFVPLPLQVLAVGEEYA